MTWDVVPVANRSRWAGALARIGCSDPYYLADYHDAYGYDGGTAFLYVAEVGGERLIHPVRRHPVESGLCDLESVYGYTGPLATSEVSLRSFGSFTGKSRSGSVGARNCRYKCPLM